MGRTTVNSSVRFNPLRPLTPQRFAQGPNAQGLDNHPPTTLGTTSGRDPIFTSTPKNNITVIMFSAGCKVATLSTQDSNILTMRDSRSATLDSSVGAPDNPGEPTAPCESPQALHNNNHSISPYECASIAPINIPTDGQNEGTGNAEVTEGAITTKATNTNTVRQAHRRDGTPMVNKPTHGLHQQLITYTDLVPKDNLVTPYTSLLLFICHILVSSRQSGILLLALASMHLQPTTIQPSLPFTHL
jgi:hypothetical protein